MTRWIACIAGLVLVLSACSSSGDPVADRASQAPVASDAMHVVVDTDMAYDDVMALLFLLRRDDVAIDAVTVTGTGEAHCGPGVENALAILTLGGSPDTPVACGRETPLAGSNAFPDLWRERSDDLSIMDLPEPQGTEHEAGAVDLLLETLDGDAALLTLGPLTNVAEALREDPTLPDRVPELVAMAGAIDVAGNTPDGVAEYNVWVDSLAAKEVVEEFESTLVPLDATNYVPATTMFVDALSEHLVTPEATAVYALMKDNELIDLDEGYSFWDSLAATLLVEPQLATWADADVLVTASQDAGAGWIDRFEGGTPIRFAATVVDPLDFERVFLSTLTGEDVVDVRPAPDLVVTFDGSACSIDRDTVTPDARWIEFVNDTDAEAGAIVIQLAGISYRELSDLLGPPGSKMIQEEPDGLGVIAWLGGPAGGSTISEGHFQAGEATVVCATGDGGQARAWISEPFVVE